MCVILGISILILLCVTGGIYLYQQEKKEYPWHLYFQKSYWLIYAIGFVAIALLVFQWFFQCEKSFVWERDGQKQHIVALIYYSEWLKEIATNIIKEHQLSIPMWDMTIGYGSDVITTLNYYVLGDPLNLLALFVKTEDIEQLYNVLVLVRMFLMGITFSIYCRYHKNGRKATLIGAYMYAFAVFALWNGVRHPYFINPMIYMPLMFLGIDKIFRKEKPYLFVFTTAIAAVSNFYFCYMLVVFCVIYVAIRYKSEVGTYRLKEILSYLLKFAGYGLLALMLAGAIFLPSAMTVLGTGRMTAENYIPVLFNLSYYEKLLVSFMSGIKMSYSARPGVVVTGLVSVFFLFAKKGNEQLKAGILILLTILCIPYAGHVLNGFSYVSYRCSFAVPFVLAYTFVKMFPEFLLIEKDVKRKVAWITGGYLLLSLVGESARGEAVFVMASLLSVCVILLLFYDEKHKVMFVTGVTGVITLVSIIFVAYYIYSPEQGDYVSEFIDKGCAVERVSNQYGTDTQDLVFASDMVRNRADNGELERTEIYGGNDITINNAMLQNYYGVSYYFSVNNPYISQFNSEMCLPFRNEYRYCDLDCRSYLQAFHNVKYHITSNLGSQVHDSTLFTKDALVQQSNYGLYEAEENIGFAYAYDTYFNRAEYEEMNVAQKQEMLLKSVMLEDGVSIDGMKCEDFNYSSIQKEYIAEIDSKIKQDGNVFDVKKKGATITLNFEGEEGCENYVLIEGLNYWCESKWERTSAKKKAKMNAYEKSRLYKDSFYYNEPTETNLNVWTDAGKGGRGFSYINSKNSFYNGITNYLCNIGYSETKVNSVNITFEKKGKYKIEGVSIYCQPVNELSQLIKERKVEGGDSFRIGTNSYDGQVTLESSKILCFSIPYSKGWTAYVDGQKQELMQTNTMYMGLVLDKGVHDIHLEYTTPYLKEGIASALAAVVILLILSLRKPKRGNKQDS